MCGIVGYTGFSQAKNVLIDGLKRLEYRGYDSAGIAVEQGCSRMDWVCLDWNTPSQKFYQSMGAQPHPEWLLFRAEGDALEKLAETK